MMKIGVYDVSAMQGMKETQTQRVIMREEFSELPMSQGEEPLADEYEMSKRSETFMI